MTDHDRQRLREQVIDDLYHVIVLANWYRNQSNYPDYVARAKQATITLGSYVAHPKAVEYLSKIGRAGYDTYPEECKILALSFLRGVSHRAQRLEQASAEQATEFLLRTADAIRSVEAADMFLLRAGGG